MAKKNVEIKKEELSDIEYEVQENLIQELIDLYTEGEKHFLQIMEKFENEDYIKQHPEPFKALYEHSKQIIDIAEDIWIPKI